MGFLWTMTCTLINLPAYPDAMGALLKSLRQLLIFSPILLVSVIGKLSAEYIVKLVVAFLASCFVGVAIGTVGYFEHWQITAATAQRYNYGRGEVGRAAGMIGDASAFGHLAGTANAFALAILLVMRRIPLVVLILCIANLALFPLFFYASLSRAPLIDLLGVLCAAIGLAVLGLYNLAVTGPRIAGLLVAAILTIPTLDVVSPVAAQIISHRLNLDFMFAHLDNPQAIFLTLGSGRDLSWNTSLHLWSEHPIFGLGYKGLFQQLNIPGDNVFVSTPAELGVVGWAEVIGGACLITWQLFRKGFRRDRRDDILFCLPAVWIGQLLHSQLADTTSFAASFPVFLMFTTIWLVAAEDESPSHAASRSRIPNAPRPRHA